MSEASDPRHFRRVLGQFPTGVVAVTSLDDADNPIGMAVGSFTSVSLSPPMVAFLPDKRSSTFPKIRKHGRFCVNVLSASQESVCRAFATSGEHKFDGVHWTSSASGLPRVTEAVAWIECEIDAVHDAGDHEIVVGRVISLDAPEASLPLLFFQGGYGRFAPLSFAAGSEPDLVEQLRLVDVARPHMEWVAEQTGVECLALTVVGEEVVVMARAGTPANGPPSRVGQRLPLSPPLASVFVAWSQAATDAWLARAQRALTQAEILHLQRLLERVRERGWSVSTESDMHRELEAVLGKTALEGLTPYEKQEIQRVLDRLESEYEPEDIDDPRQNYRIRNVTVPVFSDHNQVVMALVLYGLPSNTAHSNLEHYLNAARATAEKVVISLQSQAKA